MTDLNAQGRRDPCPANLVATESQLDYAAISRVLLAPDPLRLTEFLMASHPIHSTPQPRAAGELARGAAAVVVEVDAAPCDVERLSALGLCAGATFRVQASAPLFRIELGGHSLALGPEWCRALRVVELSA